MFNFKQALLAASIGIAASSANAALVDFVTMANQNPGESAWQPLQVAVDGATMTINGYKNGNLAFAYLDYGFGGLGVCGSAIADSRPNDNSNNVCSRSDDDNVTVGEYLEVSFDKDVVINSLWFNNNHDGGLGAGDKVTVDGIAYNVATGGPNNWANPVNGGWVLKAGEKLDIAYNNEEFYVSGMDVSTVPIPGTLGLLGLGLAGLGAVRRKKV